MLLRCAVVLLCCVVSRVVVWCVQKFMMPESRETAELASDVHHALGLAYAALHQHDRALHHLRHAIVGG